MQGVLGFTILFMGLSMVGFLLLAATGLDLVTAGTAVVACITTVGPALGEVGPTDTYALLTPFAKFVCTLCMLLGRLEILTVMVLFLPSFWKR